MRLEFFFSVIGVVGFAVLAVAYAVEGSVIWAVLCGLGFAFFVWLAVRDYRRTRG